MPGQMAGCLFFHAIICFHPSPWASQVAQMVKCLPAMRETWMGSIPGSGRSPGEEMAIHSRTLAWKIPWMDKPGGLQSMGSQRVKT